MTLDDALRKIAALESRADRLALEDARVELRRERDRIEAPQRTRETIRAARDELRRERLDAEREQRRRTVANAPQALDIAAVVAGAERRR